MRTLVNREPAPISCYPNFTGSYDVVIVGLGTTGALAAVTAAEYGLNVLGTDKMAGMGGLGVYGCVWDYFYGSPDGRFEKINERARALFDHGYTLSEPRDGSFGNRCIPGITKETALEEAAVAADCTLWYETTVCGVFTDESNVITGVRCIHSGKIIDVRTRTVIDCTGRASICKMLGAAISSGRVSDGKHMLYSKSIGLLENGLARGAWCSNDSPAGKSIRLISHEIIEMNTRSPCLNEKYTEDKRMIYEGGVLGLRESERVIALNTLTFADYVNGNVTDEPAFYVFTPLDNVNSDYEMESDVHQDWSLICRMRGEHFMKGYGFTIAIPAGIMIPVRGDGSVINGLLVAGKGMGIDHDLCTGFRMKKDFEKSGETAAVLAYLSKELDYELHGVPYAKLKECLERTGCLNKENNIGIALLHKKSGKYNESVTLPVSADDVKSVIASDVPSLGYWAVRTSKGEYDVQLKEWLNDNDPVMRERYAIAAGIRGISEAVPTLRDIAACDKSDSQCAKILLRRLMKEI